MDINLDRICWEYAYERALAKLNEQARINEYLGQDGQPELSAIQYESNQKSDVRTMIDTFLNMNRH